MQNLLSDIQRDGSESKYISEEESNVRESELTFTI